MKSFKVISLSIIALIVIISILHFNNFAKKYFINSNKILYNLNLLDNYENDLNYNILKNSLFLYTNNDEIVKKIKLIDSRIDKTISLKFLQKRHLKVYNNLLEYKKAFEEKKELIYELFRYAFPLKNSLTYLGYSLKDLNFSNPSSKYAISYISLIFLAKSANDETFLKEIDLSKLKGLNKYLILNLKIFIEYFPKYKFYLSQILHYKTQQILHKTLNNYMKVLNRDLKLFEVLSYLMVTFLIIIFMGIIYLILILEKTIKDLKFITTHDLLTSLPNRYKLLEDSKKGDFAFVLINIDKFKNINDYFGIEVGDKVLKIVANKLKGFAKDINGKVYRIGADDFGILVKNIDLGALKIEVEKLINKLEQLNYLMDNKLKLNITFSAGISYKMSYLETADLALKKIKNSVKEKVGIYTEKDLEKIRCNIQKSNEILEILKQDNLKLVFQPIVDKNRNIIKYEVLSRIEKDGELKSIFPYLEVLKENKLYTTLTLKVLSYSLNILNRYKDINLSINLSMEDILDEEVYIFIKNNFLKFGDRVTFEILESEIGDYDKFEEFVKDMQKNKINFAIDDFGSGYSDFVRIMKLDIDYLKIDGSFIKNLNKDKVSNIFVDTIVTFSKKLKIKTIAEFIHNKEIFEICNNKGIDYFQGYYLGEPQEYFNYK